MAAISIIGSHFPGNLSDAKKDNNVLRLSFCSPRNTTNMSNNKRRFLSVSASYNDSPRKMDTTNRVNVNGINVAEAPLQAGKLANESAADEAIVTSLRGRFVEGKFVFRQIFVIRSYEIGPDKTATMETIMNFLQETALNHVTSSGIGGEGFGATREMSLRKLIWVVTRIQVQVQRYNKWGDEIEVDTWVDAAGKNGMRRDWIIRDHYTKEIITRATSTWVIMNRQTRRLSKIPEEVKQELLPFYLNNRLAVPTEEADSEKIDKLTDETAQRIRSGLAPRWNDMDANQHVNNVKYIGWILESVPIEVLEHYNMTSMTLEFRRECTQSNLLESMTCPTARVMESNNNSKNRKPELQYTHLLRLQQYKADVIRARTEWNLKQKQQ
ncbi:palmitoyl-acyl carrier protein thioesterase, chloroplastic-like isoform X1 [Glycine soja]|uniref:Acyl-[acyl-carrier-protein] hydrolase n=1 Tax=Glycine soja TaxID=3848 RepID=A0A0B2QQU8_GLYSO|nr:palmitoyl-acyl carrier protein thioesterase, chloroplastic-like isoform X1 [Glycine soja]KHN23971.1 Myristoyl-acyl carrier protein thioesterase, chloroplastic [Glycine soja]RZC17392.1 Palmitoyl-acyl carrier protein thioesterase, chloroplastic [Glycine soja]